MIIIGHRGARGLAPENTLAAIKKAMSYHADEIEVDVRITRDGVAVLNHDRNIMTDGGIMSITSHTYEEIRGFKPDVATLADALKTTANRVPLVIELKHGEPIPPVVQVIEQQRALTRTMPKILLSSKSNRVLTELHRALPEVPKIVLEPWFSIRARYRAKRVGTTRIGMRSWWLWTGFLQAMARRGYQIVPYTMNKPRKVAKWAPYIYGIYTDYPDRFTNYSRKP